MDVAVMDVGNPHPALQNEYILEYLFGFLSSADVKSCRQVNQVWKHVGSRLLRKNGNVVFKFQRGIQEMKEAREKVMEVANYCQSNAIEWANTPFCTFRFVGDIPIYLLQSFVKKADMHCRKLVIRAGKNTKAGKKGLELGTIIGPHLQTFSFLFAGKTPPSVFTLSLDRSFLLQELTLTNCEVKVGRYENRLTLQKLHLGKSIIFTRNAKPLDRVILNEIVDFRTTKNIFVHGDGKSIVLDFAERGNGNIIRNVVTLKEIEVINWNKCDWKTNVLSLEGIPFLENNFLYSRVFVFSGAPVNLSMIHNPSIVKKLVVKDGSEIVQSSFYFPNLCDLMLISSTCIPHLGMFSKHKKVRTLHLAHYWSRSPMDIPYESVACKDLPANVQNLYLDRVWLVGDGKATYALTVLKFMGNPYHKPLRVLEETLITLKPRRLIYYNPIFKNRQLRKLTNFIKDHIISLKVINTFSVGNILWDDVMRFKNSEFSKLVNKKAPWYDFKRQHNYVGHGRRRGIEMFKLPPQSGLWGMQQR